MQQVEVGVSCGLNAVYACALLRFVALSSCLNECARRWLFGQSERFGHVRGKRSRDWWHGRYCDMSVTWPRCGAEDVHYGSRNSVLIFSCGL